MMSNHVVPVVVKSARRMPDPNFGGAETHYMLVPASKFPVDIPMDANPRGPNVNRPVYRDVSRSLCQQDDSVEGTFHLKHRGIAVAADLLPWRAGTRVSFGGMSRRALVFEQRDRIREIAASCNTEGIAIFGSVARGEDTGRSDCDFLADFGEGTTLLDVARLGRKLEELLGCPVDVVSRGTLSPRLAGSVVDAISL